ncbi:hypothetical protein DSM3645_17460 [Blastopirellula marina DSM 3645]|uniref:Uncharacterized protein n=1 Tax=Blastopirellula marina DSM 3645 TaxID=314230 RepID=A3ZNR4_9BACT|nr:hypothetical protein DSM3645_17460 [Blastopirellula marina DSM 3645]
MKTNAERQEDNVGDQQDRDQAMPAHENAAASYSQYPLAALGEAEHHA